MAGEIGFDAVVDHFTLATAELEQLRNKYAETRLGFAVQYKFLLWRGRFPRGRHQLPDDAVEHVGRQVGVEASMIDFYDLTGRIAGRHRQEIRGVTGFRVCSAGDADKLTTYLADQVAPTERREDQVRAELLAACRAGLIEPPTPDRQRRIIRSALRQAEQRLFAQTVQRLDAHASASVQLDALIARARDDSDETAWAESPPSAAGHGSTCHICRLTAPGTRPAASKSDVATGSNASRHDVVSPTTGGGAQHSISHAGMTTGRSAVGNVPALIRRRQSSFLWCAT